MEAIVDACRVLGDETRLRLLRLLAREELNVTELTAILGVSQSGVSRHLRMLREAGLVRERREGSWTFFSMNGAPDGPVSQVWQSARPLVESGLDRFGDLARLEDELRLRRERASSPFGPNDERLPVPGRSWIAWARALLMLVPPVRVVDVGCGDGGLAREMARFASEVIAIDRSPAVLERARAMAKEEGIDNIRFTEGELEALPLADASVGLCVLSQILHHAARPQRALDEAARVLVEGGRLLILDLAPHGEEWVRDKIGDQWLGFEPDKITAMVRRTGMTDVRHDRVPRLTSEPFEVTISVAIKTGASDGARHGSSSDQSQEMTRERPA